MNIIEATKSYETWLAGLIPLIREDLQFKHDEMRRDLFSFLRATYYRWAQVWPDVCPELAHDAVVLAVGDLHVENFGTWRDVDGRLVWGVNDFDEAFPMSYVNDLVRLAVSAHLAAETRHIPLEHKDICDSLLEGYTDSMREGGRPFVLEETHAWLRQIANSELRDPIHFWGKMDALPTLREPVQISAIDAIEHL